LVKMGWVKNLVPKETMIMFISTVCCLVIAFAKREGNIEAPFGLDEVQSVGGMLLSIFMYHGVIDSTLQGGALPV